MNGEELVEKYYEQMCGLVGPRYARCWIGNYEIRNDEYSGVRQDTVNDVEKFSRELFASPRNGKNLILQGNCGTGKDHLAVSIIRVALARGLSVKYVRGSVLCGLCRLNLMEHKTDVPLDYLKADLLVISDIEPNNDKASDFEARALLELIDYRYSQLLPTVVTSNLESIPKLSELVGERIVDRLRHNFMFLPMLWTSYRKSGGK